GLHAGRSIIQLAKEAAGGGGPGVS
ncbi:MAG: hypothetical protein K1000chlam3_01230, partial [Chlamydiae bacterium]|nr:hypothetical protein [Chlamydiota bacterium]